MNSTRSDIRSGVRDQVAQKQAQRSGKAPEYY